MDILKKRVEELSAQVEQERSERLVMERDLTKQLLLLRYISLFIQYRISFPLLILFRILIGFFSPLTIYIYRSEMTTLKQRIFPLLAGTPTKPPPLPEDDSD